MISYNHKDIIMNEKGFQELCKHHIINHPYDTKWLYWQSIPVDYVGKELRVEIGIIEASWKDIPEITELETYDQFEQKKSYKQFSQKCDLNLRVVLVSSIVLAPQYLKVEVDFTVKFLKPHYKEYEIHVETSYTKAFNNFQTEILNIQNRFGLKSIEKIEFKSQTAFGFFCDVTRKARSVQPQNSNIGNGSYFYQIAHAHEELSTSISNLLSCIPFLSKLTSRKVSHEGDNLYFPVHNPINYKFNFWCSVCIERLYTFWETLIVLLYNFDTLNIKIKRLSFSHYFEQADKVSNFVLNKTSANYNWLKGFADNDFKNDIVRYRHRIVHHEFTNEHEGLLSAKFYINAYENVANKSVLDKLQKETDTFPQLMIKHFDYCKEGFEKALLLIDELS